MIVSSTSFDTIPVLYEPIIFGESYVAEYLSSKCTDLMASMYFTVEPTNQASLIILNLRLSG